MSNKLWMVVVIPLLTACPPEISRHNYEFQGNVGIAVALWVRQDEPPTPQQVASMAEMAGRSRWSFCGRKDAKARHECISGMLTVAGEYPSRASCYAALSSINAVLRRTNLPDQQKVCEYKP